jgi:hypothetical protein
MFQDNNLPLFPVLIFKRGWLLMPNLSEPVAQTTHPPTLNRQISEYV